MVPVLDAPVRPHPTQHLVEVEDGGVQRSDEVAGVLLKEGALVVPVLLTLRIPASVSALVQELISEPAR
jgi:hypothetical protein